MYNTNRLANSARKAERDGRPFEAQQPLGSGRSPAPRSVVVRHPHSKYADAGHRAPRPGAVAARPVPGGASDPLSRADARCQPGDLAEEALLALGRCQMEMGDPAVGRSRLRAG